MSGFKIVSCLLSIASILIAINCNSNHKRILDLESKMESFKFRLNAVLGHQAGLKKEILNLQRFKEDKQVRMFFNDTETKGEQDD